MAAYCLLMEKHKRPALAGDVTEEFSMRAIAINGVKRSGKTSLLGLLAQALEHRGCTVAILKYTSHPLERANSDVFWLMRPEKERTVISLSPEETAVIWPQALSFDAIVPLIRADVLLVEGGKDIEGIPRILCFKDDGAEEMPLLEPESENPGPILASVGGEAPGTEYPHYEEAGLEAANALAELVLEKGLELNDRQQKK